MAKKQELMKIESEMAAQRKLIRKNTIGKSKGKKKK